MLFSFKDSEYRKISTKQGQIVHILEVDPKKYTIKSTLPDNNKISKDTVLNISKNKKALAAINGGFFKIGENQDALPMGILKVDSNFISLPRCKRADIGWSENSTNFLIDVIDVKAEIELKDFSFPIDSINREKIKKEERILYFPIYYHMYTKDDFNSILIPSKTSNKSFLALDIEDPILEQVKFYPFNLKVNIFPKYFKETESVWNSFNYIVGGCPLLILSNKKILFDGLKNEKFIQRNARTAIGINENKNIIFAVVENNFRSNGMSLKELQNFMYEINCSFAINLDGGSSSCMVINNKIVNQLNMDEDDPYLIRKISDAILIFEKN